MAIPNQYQHLTALTRSCDELYHALDAGHRRGAWKAVRDALGWLHRIEELAKKHVPDYYAIRANSPEGRTLAGLIWVRTVVDHHGAAVLARGSTATPVKRFGGPRGTAFVQDASGRPTELAESMIWPDRASLPPGKPEKHGRDVLYDTHVAGRGLLSPLRGALSFLTDL